MLTAYTYYEPSEQIRIQKEIKGSRLFEEEISIANRFTKKHLNARKILTDCPVCKKGNVKKFFQKEGIDYFRCQNCYSIIAGVETEAALKYEQLPELISFYESDEYQDLGKRLRVDRWNEIIDWISFRAFRYLGKNEDFTIVDYGNRWREFRKIIEESKICGSYIFKHAYEISEGRRNKADIIIAFDCIQRKTDPIPFLSQCLNELQDNGLLFLGLKAGSGMDVLLLKEKNKNVFPFEHILIPSKEGIYEMLDQSGYEVLEFITPGTFDVNYIKDHIEDMPEDNAFMQYLLHSNNVAIEAEFQRFIQKAGMSSYAQVVARKKNEKA